MAAAGSPSFTLDRLHLRGGHAAADGKGGTGWAVWAVSRGQNNGLFTSPASELDIGHQQRKGLTVPLRTPSLPKGQKCQLSLSSSCLVATLVPQGPGPCSLPAGPPSQEMELLALLGGGRVLMKGAPTNLQGELLQEMGLGGEEGLRKMPESRGVCWREN